MKITPAIRPNQSLVTQSDRTLLLIVSLLLLTAWIPATVRSFGAEVGNRAYGENWQQSSAAKHLEPFHNWVNQYITSSNTTIRSQMRSDGVALARQRTAEFRKLMNSDPHQALQASVPAGIRKQLPVEVERELEVAVSGVGDFHVTCAMAAKDGAGHQPIERFATLNGRVFRAHVYGRRAHQGTKYGIPLHGVIVGDDLVLHESALRELESDELSETTRPIADLSTPLGKQPRSSDKKLAQVGDGYYRFESKEQMQHAERLLNAAEDGLGPKPTRTIAATLESVTSASSGTGLSTSPLSESPYTEGRKSVLIIRVDFSDLPGDPGGGTYTAAYVQHLSDTEITPFFQQSSYGITDLTNIVTQVFRMPQTAADYATNAGSWQLHLDAVEAATPYYNVDNYDRVMVLFSWLGSYPDSLIRYGGMAEVGGRRIWVNGEFDFRVVAHELGHTYGLWHGNLWQVSDGDAISSSGQRVEYGDDFDTMGANFANDPHTDFNPWFKSQLNWLRDDQVQTVTTNGIYRVKRFDSSTADGVLALKISKDSDRNYWIGCRRNFADNVSMQNGAYVVWGYNSNQGSDLLDMSTPGESVRDAALAVGALFTDNLSGITIRPASASGSSPNEYVDIQVAFGSAPEMPPRFTTSPTNQSVSAGHTAYFSVAASIINI